MRTNVKNEFLDITKGLSVVCAIIHHSDRYSYDEYVAPKIKLFVNYTEKDWDRFLKSLDFTYDNDYGSQELYGIIWCKDGIWIDRSEYDGSEWWQIHKCPEIPEVLM